MQHSSRARELPSGRVPHTVPYRAAYHNYENAHRIPLIDGLGPSHRLATCVIMSVFGAALDLDTYPLSNLIRPWCAERAKPGRGKPVHIGFFACFHAISLEHSRFSKIAKLIYLPL